MPNREYPFERTLIDKLDEWIMSNFRHFEDTYNINLYEDKDQWVIDLIREAYEYGVSTENSFMTKHERGS